MRKIRIGGFLLSLLLGATAAASGVCPPLFSGTARTHAITEAAWHLLAGSKLRLSGMRQAAFVLIAPTSEAAFQNAFGKSQVATAKNLRSQRQLATKAKAGGIIPFSEASQGEIQLRAIIDDRSLKLVVIAGHNENGHLFLPDGGKVSLKELLGRASSEKLVIVVSCSAKAEAPYIEGLVDNAITATDALQLLEAYQSLARISIEAGTSPSYKDFIGAKRDKSKIVIRLESGGKTRWFAATMEMAGKVQIVTIVGPCPPGNETCRST